MITTINEFKKFYNYNLIRGGLSAKKTVKDIAKIHNVSTDEVISKLKKGIKIELEHTSDERIATEIAMDHLIEMLDYYEKLETIEERLNRPQEFPSLEFAQQTGIDFVTTDWKLPKDVNEFADELHDAFDTDNFDMLKSMYAEVINLNPQLKNIKLKTYGDLYGLIYGAISKFNYDDIKFFIEQGENRIRYNLNADTQDRRANIMMKYKVNSLQWVLSPTTLQKLEEYDNNN